MTPLIVSIVVFIVLLVLPIGYSTWAMLYTKGSALPIKNSTVKDPRFFVKSFTRKIDTELMKYDGSGKILLSKEENIVEADESTALDKECDNIILIRNDDFSPPAGLLFNKEIYAFKNVFLSGVESVRAIACKGDLYLGKKTVVERWVDAEGLLAAGDDCELGVSASSLTKLVVGTNCRFTRLFAPVIFFGEEIGEPVEISNHWRVVNVITAANKAVRNIKYVDDQITDENGVLDATVITKHPITVLNGLSVKGHIRSHGSIRLGDDSTVFGNVFAEGEIYIGRNVRVYGSVFSQENIHVEAGSVIGQHGVNKSVIGRKEIVFEKDCCVFGYVSTEACGISVPDESKKMTDIFDEDHLRHEDRKKLEDIRKAYTVEGDATVVFPDPNTPQPLVPFGFRKSELIGEVVVPEGVRMIHPSFFFSCEKLRKVVLPSTLLEIGDFAFYGCSALSEISLQNCPSIRSVGKSAFAGCGSLREIFIPKSCGIISGAAFSGSGIEDIQFESSSSLVELSDHVFKDCTALKRIAIPSSVKSIGISAFYGCTALQDLTVPESVEKIGGYAFCGCSSLKDLLIPSRRLESDSKAFEGYPGKVDIVPVRPGVQVQSLPLRSDEISQSEDGG